MTAKVQASVLVFALRTASTFLGICLELEARQPLIKLKVIMHKIILQTTNYSCCFYVYLNQYLSKSNQNLVHYLSVKLSNVLHIGSMFKDLEGPGLGFGPDG